jgi:protein-S-isoprenylcysteine O-methyltransferase Ste14
MDLLYYFVVNRARAFVWCGGALFVLSLALCAYSYVVPWSAGGAGGGWRAAAVDAILLTLFAAHHSIFAREPVKRWLARHLAAPLLRSVYVWAAALLLLLTCALWQAIGGDFYHARNGVAALAALVQLLGVWVIARAVATIDPLELAGIRQIEPATQAAPPAERLQIIGPYRLVRHPVYFGWLLIVFGAAHMTGDRLAFAVVTTIYLVIAIPWEERSLTSAFGDEYEEYKRLVRWRLLPYVY